MRGNIPGKRLNRYILKREADVRNKCLQEIITELPILHKLKGTLGFVFLPQPRRLLLMLALSFMPNICCLKVKRSTNWANRDTPMLTAANKVNIKDRR